MTQVDFHYNAAEPMRLAAELVAAFVQSGRKVLVYAPDAGKYQGFDRILWTFAQLSFVPHCAPDADVASETPVWLAAEQQGTDAMDDVLVNLSDDVPTFFSRFTTVVETVGLTEEERLPGRARYKFYQDRGYIICRADHQK